MSLESLTLVFLRQRERLRYRETLRSLNAFRSSPKPSLGNFRRAYWYLWAASFIFPFWRTHGGQTHAMRNRTEPGGKRGGEKQGTLFTGHSHNSCSLAQALPFHQSHRQTQITHKYTHLLYAKLNFTVDTSPCKAGFPPPSASAEE